MRLPDRQRSHAVLIGTGRYTDDKMPDLPVVGKTIGDLATALTDPVYGVIPENHCTVLEDQADIRLIGRNLRSAGSHAEDLLLVYFVGHGLVGGRRHELYLGLPDSEWAEPEFNSLEYDKLRSAVLDSAAKTKIIIVDCCFSGRVVSEAMAARVTEMVGELEVAGTYVLTSARHDQAALILPGEDYTAFTGRFLHLLRDGVPGGPELLTIDYLYRQLAMTMRAEGLSQPQKRGTATADLLALARNRALEQARREAEEQARREAEEQARREAEEQARREAEEQARREAEEQARREAEEQARREAEEQARREAEEQARREAEEQARREAEEQARREAEEQARREAESTTVSRFKGLDAPMIMRIGAARLTAGLDRMPRLDLDAHRDIFGLLPRLSAEELISMAEQVDLRGQGGAAFPFARKLQAVVNNAEANGRTPIVVVNATESEPGSVKDKMLMIRSPYLILSGAALVAEAIGAEEIVVGVTGNELANRSIEAAIAAEAGLRKLARMVQMPDRFISGESGALVRGINGKRPIPPARKVLASDFGVANLPTLLSNASTFAQLAVLALLGPERFAAVGTPEEPGTVLLSVGGSAAQPTVVEVPTGILLAAVLDLCQAPAGDGVLVGGYRGMWLPAGTAYVVPVSRDGLAAVGGTLGSGIVLPLGDGTCPLGEVSRIASYLAGESAGQCGPCKLGLPSVAQALAAVIDGSGGIEALDVARRSAAAVAGRGACTHPDGVTRFVLSALDVFTEDLAAHVFHSSCGRPVREILPLPTGPEQDRSSSISRFRPGWRRTRGGRLASARHWP